MRRRNAHAFVNRLFTLNAKNDCLSSVCNINLFACAERLAEFIKLSEARSLCRLFCPSRNLPFRFAIEKEILVALRKGVASFKLFIA